ARRLRRRGADGAPSGGSRGRARCSARTRLSGPPFFATQEDEPHMPPRGRASADARELREHAAFATQEEAPGCGRPAGIGRFFLTCVIAAEGAPAVLADPLDLWHNRQVVAIRDGETAPSYSGLVRRPLTAVTRVRIPLGSPQQKPGLRTGLLALAASRATRGRHVRPGSHRA